MTNETIEPTLEETQPSRLKKIGKTATTVGFIAIPTVIYGVAIYYGVRTAKARLEYIELATEALKTAK